MWKFVYMLSKLPLSEVQKSLVSIFLLRIPKVFLLQSQVENSPCTFIFKIVLLLSNQINCQSKKGNLCLCFMCNLNVYLANIIYSKCVLFSSSTLPQPKLWKLFIITNLHLNHHKSAFVKCLLSNQSPVKIKLLPGLQSMP